MQPSQKLPSQLRRDPPPTAACLELRSLAKTYSGDIVGLHPTDLIVPDGEGLGILGPSGSGKSTLLRLIAGLEEPSAGSIFLDGQEISRLSPHERGIAWMPQKPALMPGWSAFDNVALGLRLRQRHLPRNERISDDMIRRKVNDSSDLLSISSLLHRPIETLSGGEQRRVGLARAIATGARLWLFDEPFGELDPGLRYEICAELLLLRGHLNTTMLFVTHDPIEAMALANRIGVLGFGRILQVDEPAKLVENPGHRTVAVCLGWPAMNFIEGKSEPSEGSVFRFRTELGDINGLPSIPIGESLFMGVRPEDIQIGRRDGVTLGDWRVEKINRHFDRSWCLMSRNGTIWHARCETNVALRSIVEVFLPTDRICWFDQDGLRL